MKDINITLVNYHTKEDIMYAIRSIMADVSDSLYNIQVIVVDNSQNVDGIKEALLESYKDVIYLDAGSNVGFGRANTIGFKHTRARYYFALNRDILIPENSRTIDRIIEFMDSEPKIGCIGPKLVNMDGSLQYACYRFDLSSILIKPLKQIGLDSKYKWVRKRVEKSMMKDFDHESTRPVDWVLGAAMVVRHEVIEQIGWFDDKYFMYFEDADWCRNMWEHGWPVYYVHDIVIKHRHERGSAQIPGIFKALLKNKLARAHLKSWFIFLYKWRKVHKYYR